jgi:hypothetical protein
MMELFTLILLTLANVFEILLLLRTQLIPTAVALVFMLLLLVFITIFMSGSKKVFSVILLLTVANLIFIAYLYLKLGFPALLQLSFVLSLLVLLICLMNLGRSQRRVIRRRMEPAVERSAEPEEETNVSRYAKASEKARSSKKGDKRFVAGKTGKQYHDPGCFNAQRISANKKVWFNTEEEAEEAGYNKHSCVDL